MPVGEQPADAPAPPPPPPYNYAYHSGTLATSRAQVTCFILHTKLCIPCRVPTCSCPCSALLGFDTGPGLCGAATGARAYTPAAKPDESRRRRDPKTGRRSDELEEAKATSAGSQQNQDRQVSGVMRQHTRANSGGKGPATMTPGYVGARRHNNEL